MTPRKAKSQIHAGDQQFKFEVVSRKRVPDKQEDCFHVTITRVADERVWNAAIHFISGTTPERAESRIHNGLEAALKIWKLDSIGHVFEIPRVLLPDLPRPHQCHWFEEEQR